MDKATFNKEFYRIEGDNIELRIIDTYEGEDGALPFYWWNVVRKGDNAEVGKISFRIGHNYHSYYNGNIGYEIDEEYQGNNYAYKACKMLMDVAIYHQMDKIYFSCTYDNIASYKTIEKLGGKLIEEITPPKDYIYYFVGIKPHKIYELEI